MRAIHVAGIALAAACAPIDADPRASWLGTTLAFDNRDLITRDPDLVAGKYAKMSLGPYAFLRGTAAQLERDAAEFFATAHAGRAVAVLRVGDPHPENVGTFRASDGPIAIDFNDFDAANFGPYYLDVWRLGQGLDVWLRQSRMSDEVRARAVEMLVRAYAEEIRGTFTSTTDGRIAADLVRRAARDGAAREELDDETEIDASGQRKLLRGELEPRLDPRVIEAELHDPSPAAAWIAHAIEREWPATTCCVSEASVRDVVRRFGSGVSSYPLERYDVLLANDVILEVKEVRDPLPSQPTGARPTHVHANNAERAVDLARRLQSRADQDPQLGWIARGALSLRVRDRTKYQKGFDVARFDEKIAEGEWSGVDVLPFARLMGATLARDHGRALTAYGEPARPSIDAAIGPDVEAFVDEAVANIGAAADRTMTDYLLFLALLEREGPLLGAGR